MRAEPNHAPAKRGATRCSGHVQLGRLPLAAPGDRERNTPRSFPTHKPERIDIDGEPGGRLPRAATPPLAGATFGRSRRLDALFLPPWRLGTSRALARSRTAGPRLAGDARRGLPRTAGRANARGELLRRARRARARLLTRDRARHAAQDRGRSATGLALRSGLGPAAASLGAALRPPGRAPRGRGGHGPPSRSRAGEAARPPEWRRARALLAATARGRRAARV